MKTTKFTVLLLSILIINCCTDKEEVEIEVPFLYGSNWSFKGAGPACNQPLLLSFQNASGNDLVKGIGFWVDGSNGITITGRKNDAWGRVKEKLYTMSIYEDSYDDYYSCPLGLRKGKPFLKKYPELNGNYDYLYFQAISMNINEEHLFNEKATFQLSCPYIFGDNEVHNIVTWWKPEKIADAWLEHRFYELAPSCYRIEIDGKEITEITYVYDAPYIQSGSVYGQAGPYSVATIILEGK